MTVMTFTDSTNYYAPLFKDFSPADLRTVYKKRHYYYYLASADISTLILLAKRLVVQMDTLNAVNKNVLHKNTQNHMYMYKTA